MQPRDLSSKELDAVSGGTLLSYNTLNFGSGNGGNTGGVLAVNGLGFKQGNSVQTGNANGAAGGAFSAVNSGSIKIFGGLF